RNQTELLSLFVSGATANDLSSLPVVQTGLIVFGWVDSPAANLSPLLALSSLTSVDLTGSPVDCASPVLAQLAARGVSLRSDCPAP
ncbi:MAG TPA: hypothetical protein VMG12_32410, partial [Polyangiaceae bacterium]|nr:hypothetical protein [Polyangiaceae bacterium]